MKTTAALLALAAVAAAQSSTPTTDAAPSVVSGAAAAPSSTATKYMWAHHIVGVTHTHDGAAWSKDVQTAKDAGIDGFALNMGADDWQPASVELAYAAADAVSDFKMFLSFDMTSLPCNTSADATRLADYVNKYATHKAQASYGGKPLVSTFGGERCTFGAASVGDGWALVRNGVKGGMTFVPATFMTADQVKGGNWFDGGMQWDSAWPMDDAAPSTTNDTAWMSALGNKAYMAAVSPFFFTYYGPNTWNKNWIYRSDDWLLATRFEQMIAMRDKLDMLEIISWNDFGESHYICDVPPANEQPNSTTWTENMPHTALLSLIKYYAGVFKTGSYPAAPDDGLWLWTRPHPKDAKPTAETLPRPARADWTDDRLYAVVTLNAPAKVTFASGTSTVSQDLPAGLSKLSVASAPGAISGKIERDGKTVASYDSTGQFEYTNTPKDWNFNYFVAEAKSGDAAGASPSSPAPKSSAARTGVSTALVALSLAALAF